jgi:hypothetical protein
VPEQEQVSVKPVQVSVNPILLGILLFFAGSLVQAKTGFPFGGVTNGSCKCDVRTQDHRNDQRDRIGSPIGSQK